MCADLPSASRRASPLWAAGFPGLQPECSGKGQKSCVQCPSCSDEALLWDRLGLEGVGRALAGSQVQPWNMPGPLERPHGCVEGSRLRLQQRSLGPCFASGSLAGFPGGGPPRPAALQPPGPPTGPCLPSPGDRPLGDPGLLSWTPTGTGRGLPGRQNRAPGRAPPYRRLCICRGPTARAPGCPALSPRAVAPTPPSVYTRVHTHRGLTAAFWF